MGWNTGYTIFEATVVGAYDLGKLDKALLEVLMSPYAQTDIDQGGSYDLKSEDGKTVEEIVVETWGLALPPKPKEDDEAEQEAYREQVYEQFDQVTRHFKWG